MRTAEQEDSKTTLLIWIKHARPQNGPILLEKVWSGKRNLYRVFGKSRCVGMFQENGRHCI